MSCLFAVFEICHRSHSPLCSLFQIPKPTKIQVKTAQFILSPLLKIGILKISGSALAAEICIGPHNRLLRRQHCSSLCSQSEGHEHVANMASALGHNFVGFSARAWSPQYSPPSLCEQSELQCFAPGLRQMSAWCPLQLCRTRYVVWFKTAQRFFLGFEHPTFQGAPVRALFVYDICLMVDVLYIYYIICVHNLRED